MPPRRRPANASVEPVFTGLWADDPRCTVRRPGAAAADGRAIVLWVQRCQRGTDNPALDAAIAAGNGLGLPVVALLAPMPLYPRAGLRAYDFLMRGLPDVARDLGARGCVCVFRPFPRHDLAAFCREVGAAAVFGDENPLREPTAWRATAAARLTVPLLTFDTECLVPPRLFPNQEFAARTLRPKYHAVMDRWLAPPGPQTRARHGLTPAPGGADAADAAVPAGWRIDRSVAPITGFPSGPRAARRALQAFVATRLAGYATARNQPHEQATSRLSPYLHFGHLGPREVASAVDKADVPAPDRAAFLEEFLVRRELAVNFVTHQAHYDSLAGCPKWGRKTLDEHRADPRPHRYTATQLRDAATHDPLWNACQTEMGLTGHMQGYLRMYWAKKILEWSPTPEAAFATAVALNDAYELDGRDPNGYTGISWAIGGLHDRPWGPARPIFGLVRYMSGASTGRKFDSAAYCAGIAALAAGAGERVTRPAPLADRPRRARGPRPGR